MGHVTSPAAAAEAQPWGSGGGGGGGAPEEGPERGRGSHASCVSLACGGCGAGAEPRAWVACKGGGYMGCACWGCVCWGCVC